MTLPRAPPGQHLAAARLLPPGRSARPHVDRLRGTLRQRGHSHLFPQRPEPVAPHPNIRRAHKTGKDYPPPGHWLVAAWRPPSGLRSFLRSEAARRVDTEQVSGVSATVLLVPPGAMAQDSAHAVVVWRLQGVGYAASVHGHTNEGIARAIARALISEMVRCPRAATSEPGCHLAIPTSAR